MRSEPNHNAYLTSGSLLARNTLWNFVGNGAPIVVAVLCIPLLIKGLGVDRFGVLSLVLAVIGYANLFDLGLGRALTQLVASKLGTGEDHEVPSLVWTSLLLMLLLGLVGTIVIVLASPWLVHRVLRLPTSLQAESLYSFYLLGLSLPSVICTAALRGLLEAQQRFDIVNALRIPLGIFSFVGPLFVLPFSRNLGLVVAVLVGGRVIGCVAHFLFCLRTTPELRVRIAWRSSSLGPLFRFGGWMTISNIIGPLMVTCDRFLIGALLSASAVAYYATPYELVTKLWIIPGALMGVMFPAFSTSSTQDQNRMALLFGRSVKYLLLVLFPMVLLVIVLAQDGLKLWLGAEFAQNSARVLQWLAVGVFVNSIAHVPFALLQGVGKPDLTAKLHMLELPAYLLALWWLTTRYGINGAAMAWTGRVAFDAIVLFVLAKRFVPIRISFSSQISSLAVVALVTLVLATFPQGLMLKGVFLLVTMLGFLLGTWYLVLSPEERSLAHSFLRA
jgi:O-antigen/teichoic acid export membrane protein